MSLAEVVMVAISGDEDEDEDDVKIVDVDVLLLLLPQHETMVVVFVALVSGPPFVCIGGDPDALFLDDGRINKLTSTTGFVPCLE